MTIERHQSDRALLAACGRGDATAWETLIQRYRRLIYSIPVNYRLDSDDADEVFQKVSLRLLTNVTKIRDPDKLAAWLGVTTRRECWAQTRESRRFEDWDELDADGEASARADEAPDVDAALDLVAREHAMALAFEQLEEPCHGLLTALYVEDPRPSYEEISARLDRPIGSLGPTRARCLKKLRRLYEAGGGAGPFTAELD